MPSSKQDQEFNDLIKENAEVEITLSSTSLDIAIDFISSNFDPDDVFSEKSLNEWAESHGFVKE